MRAGRRGGEEDARREPQYHRDPRRGPRRIPPIARDTRPHEPRDRGGASQDQGEQARVHEPVGGKPEHARMLTQDGIHHGHEKERGNQHLQPEQTSRRTEPSARPTPPATIDGKQDE